MSKKIYFAVLFMALFFSNCDNSNGGLSDSFDRKSMLQAYAAYIIRPAFDQLQVKVNDLHTAFVQYEAAQNTPNLEQVKTSLAGAYGAFQQANAFNFGPAGENGTKKGLVEEIGTFPVNTALTETFITNNDYSLNNFNRDTRGFAALEYLLYFDANGTLSDNATRRAYFRAVLNHIMARVADVKNGWETYATAFVDNNGTDAGSSTSMLYNEFVRSFEAIKNFKVGLPAGKRPGQTAPAPELAEGYYSGQSLDLLKAHLAAIDLIYHGNANVNGFDAYLNSITGGTELVAATEAQWAKVNAVLNNIPTDQPFNVLLAQNHPMIDSLHTELQRHTRFFKSEMSSIMGIAITFSSGDGD